MSESNSVVTRAALAMALQARRYGSKAQTREIVDTLITVITEALELGDPVHLSGLGRFEVAPIAERPGRNLRTGEPCVIRAHRRLKFKPSKTLHRQLNAEAAP